MSNQALLAETARAARDERQATAELLALLGEVDQRQLYLGEGCSSLFAYCTEVLHLSEHAAYHRIEAARASRRFPAILTGVASGELTLTSVALLRPHLTDANHNALLTAAKYKTKREVEHQVACLAPKPDAKTVMRRLPEVRAIPDAERRPVRSNDNAANADGEMTVGTSLVPPPPPGPRTTIAPLARDRFLLRVTLSADAHATLRRAQDLMRHTLPDGDPAAILQKALTLLVEQLEKSKAANVVKPRAVRRTVAAASSRHIPAGVRREVWKRDCGQCAFVGPHGRCSATGRLEFHHIAPYARGGPITVSNIALRCRAHNSFESEQLFGRWSASATRSGPS